MAWSTFDAGPRANESTAAATPLSQPSIMACNAAQRLQATAQQLTLRVARTGMTSAPQERSSCMHVTGSVTD